MPRLSGSPTDDPIWVRRRVPNGYWTVRANRLRYLYWLGARLRYPTREDWYGLTRAILKKHYGGGLLQTVYRDSPLAALRDLNPTFDWKPWLMTSTPQRFWHQPAHRREFFDWLGRQLGYRRPEDWYALRSRDIRRHGGGGLLQNVFGNSVLAALLDYRPAMDWKPWLMTSVPQRYWRVPANRRAYLDWLGRRLRYRRPEDWYALRAEHLEVNGGMTLLHTWAHNSPQGLLREYIPDQDWHEWLFPRVPRGFWRRRNNRERFMRWVGEQLGFKTADDWYDLRKSHIRQLGGASMLQLCYRGSVQRLMTDRLVKL